MNFRVLKWIAITALVLYFIWVSILFKPLMIYDPVHQDDSQVVTSSLINYDISSASSITPIESTILPKSNMTVNQYISGQEKQQLELQVKSLNSTHWFSRSEYTNVSGVDTPFDSIINRESTNHYYNSSNYWDWDGNLNIKFDFWIDTTKFSKDYKFLVLIPGFNYRNITILDLENITMDGVKTFEAWKMSVDIPFPNFSYYERSTGLFLSSYLFFAPSQIWYNLTALETESIPDGYFGPTLTNASPSNGSLLASGSLISVEFTSPYGLAVIDYNWDGQTNLSTSLFIETSIPISGGLHNLSIIAYDNLGFYRTYFLVYETDISLAGIILNSPRNNSRIQGLRQIELAVVSGNGTMIINWDNNPFNESKPIIANEVVLLIPNGSLEIPHNLTVYVNNSDGIWTKARYFFFIDNSFPLLKYYHFVNNSVYKGHFNILLEASEDSTLTYSLNGSQNSSQFLEESVNKSLEFKEENNGTYQLYLEFIDEAGNINSYLLTFFIHTSDFDWNWEITSEETHSLDLYDDNKTYWFTSSVVSKSNQFYNFSMLTDDSNPSLRTDFILGVGFQCEVPADIIFLTLTYPLSEQLGSSTDTFPLYKWVVWENQEWVEVDTIYDQVSHSWITTYLGYSQYFALIDSGEITQLKSVIVGGGSIPAFELPTILFSVCVVVLIKKVKN